MQLKTYTLIRIWKRIRDWEKWPFKVIYAPLGFVWLYYAIKARAFWFFSNVNPTLEFSGFEGEGKKEMYDQLPSHLIPATIHVPAHSVFENVLQQVQQAHIAYPLVVKPEVGMQGILFRRLSNEQQLLAYHSAMPFDYMIQEYVDLPYEFSVFHIRYPGSTKGEITGLILKEYMMVEGDGSSTLQELIRAHPKARYRQAELHHKHYEHLQEVIPAGTKYYLNITGNHNRGARFINLHREIDEQLTTVFDQVSIAAQHFYFGRYDLKCTSLQDLRQGKNIKILEYNGTGAEPNHIYDCGMKYIPALKEIAKHWEHMYRIGVINKKKGVPYWSFLRGHRYLKRAGKVFASLRAYDNKL